MKNMFTYIGIGLLSIAFALIVIMGISVSYVRVANYITPAMVDIENNAFHQSQAYNDGMARDLDELKMAYDTATPEGKESIKASIRHRFASYDYSKLPPDLQQFLSQMKQ